MPRPKVAILAIGNELLRGDVENSNMHWLCQRFTARAALVVHAAVVRDEVEHISRELHHALSYHPKLILTTGGLGPTADDLTLRGVARATKDPLEPNPEAIALVTERYSELEREGAVASAELTPSRRKMGVLPRSAVPLENHVGAAPGVALPWEGVTLVCLPGVPAELHHIFNGSLAPILDRAIGTGVQREITRYADTSDESRLAAALEMAATHHPDVYLKSHATSFQRGGKFRITLSTIAGDEREADALLRSAELELTDALRSARIRLSKGRAYGG